VEIKAVVRLEDGTREVTSVLSEEQIKFLLQYAFVSLIEKGIITAASEDGVEVVTGPLEAAH
jgi:hypothetical protein